MVVAVGVGGLCVNEEVKCETGVRRSGSNVLKEQVDRKRKRKNKDNIFF